MASRERRFDSHGTRAQPRAAQPSPRPHLHSGWSTSAMKHARKFPAVILSALLVIAATSVPTVGAQAAPHCDRDQSPQFVFGFASLKAQLGDAMGEPVSCEYSDPNGTGDTLQDTSRGLAFWRKSTNTPTFTDGAIHWAIAGAGLVTWTASSIDPPPLALQPTPPPARVQPVPAPPVAAPAPAPAPVGT